MTATFVGLIGSPSKPERLDHGPSSMKVAGKETACMWRESRLSVRRWSILSSPTRGGPRPGRDCSPHRQPVSVPGTRSFAAAAGTSAPARMALGVETAGTIRQVRRGITGFLPGDKALCHYCHCAILVRGHRRSPLRLRRLRCSDRPCRGMRPARCPGPGLTAYWGFVQRGRHKP
jgi:hypothetical protein